MEKAPDQEGYCKKWFDLVKEKKFLAANEYELVQVASWKS